MIDEKVLIERLEVLKKDKYVFAPTMCYAFEKVEEIVKELASERNNDFCEWKFEKTTGIVWHCDSECTTYNLTYAKGLENYLKDFESKCPYCGKKIKVHEPEGE